MAKIPLNGDMGEHDSEEHEISEVVSVLHETAIVAAEEAGGRPRQDERSVAEMMGQLRVGLERPMFDDTSAHPDCFGREADGTGVLLLSTADWIGISGLRREGAIAMKKGASTQGGV